MLLWPLHAQAQEGPDRSSLNTTKISVPSGPGSIEGLGESFEPQWNSGTYRLSVPLKLPALRGSVQPEIALGYDSGNGNGPVGLGWKLSVPFLQRQTDKGMPRYTAEDTIVDWTGEELVRLADGTWRAENESGFVKWENLGADGWRGTRPDGTVLRFGATAQARLDRTAALGGGTFRWLLESAEDTNGNRVVYRYTADRTAAPGGDTLQVYLTEIEWGLHVTAVSQTLKLTLDYAMTRPDPVEDYRGGFRVATRRRLESLTLTHGARRLRHWHLGYQAAAPVSLLESFKVYGDDRALIGAGEQKDRDYLPPMTFHYAPSKLGEGAVFADGGPFFNVSFAQGEADFVDLDRDGLPDLLYAENGNFFSRLNRGPGQTFGPVAAFTSDIELPALTTSGVRLSDFRGDAITKVLIPDNGGFYYRDFTGPTTVGGDVDYPVPGHFPLIDPQVQMMDVNNDRALDFLALDDGRASWVLSSPTGAAPVFGEQPRDSSLAGVNFSSGEWQLADLNGDRIPDLVQIVLNRFSRDGLGYRPGLGYGRFAADVPMSGGPLENDLGSRGRGGLSLVDLDLDGLADLVYVDSGVVKIWRNLAGKAWAEPISLASAQVPDWNDGATAVRFVDLNGNGTVDLVWNDPSASIFLRHLELHPATRPHQLIRIDNGIGKSTEITYGDTTALMLAAEAAGQPWSVKPPFPLPVVTRLAERDGMGGEYVTEVTYRNGYYDAAEREFRGFERAIVTEVGSDSQHAPSLVTEYEFDTGAVVEALKGRPKRVVSRETGGAVFHEAGNDWTPRVLPVATAAGETRMLTYTFLERETKRLLEKGQGTPVTLLKENDFDDYGNAIREADYGRVQGADRSFGDDERVITRVFTAAFADGLNRWILNRPVEETLADEHGAALSHTLTFYDDETFAGANRGAVTKGNATLVKQAIDATAGTSILAQRTRYDAFGNPVRLYDPLGVPGNDAAGHYRAFAFDETFHTYPVREVVGVGNTGPLPELVAAADYDVGLGLLTAYRDFNGNESTFGYDPLARLVSVVKPGDSPDFPTETYSYHLAEPLEGGRIINWIESRKRETAGGGTIDTRQFFDGLGRKLMTRSEGATAGEIVVTEATRYNARKQPWRVEQPYFDTGTLAWKEPAAAPDGFTESRYDALARVVETQPPPETAGGARLVSRTRYEPLVKRIFDEEDSRPGSPHADTPMVHYEDGLGRLIGVDEVVKLTDDGRPGAVTAWPTRYRYDLNDQLIEILDGQNNRKLMTYDGLKRMTFMNDPDRGHLTYVYDDASNLRETLDAKDQRIVYTYDGANRIKTEDYRDGGPRVFDVEYFYDQPAGALTFGDGTSGTATQVKGQLAWVRDLSGETHFSYDARARIAWQVKRVPNAAGVLANYRTGFSYDSADRLTAVLYPDGDRISHDYDPRGLAQRLHGALFGNIVASITYRASGQLKDIAYGNGVATAYTYDPRLRLASLQTLPPAAAGDAFIDFRYEFDGASNLTRIDDQRPVAGPRQNTQVFAYDSLYRLTRTEYPTVQNGGTGWLDYRYDRIGNMLAQTSNLDHQEKGLPVANLGEMQSGGEMGRAGRIGRMTDDPPGPHALTRISRDGAPDRQYDYDANGNMTALDGLALTWDFKDRLIAAEDATMRATYTYDYTDRRIAKTVAPKAEGGADVPPARLVTYYPDRHFELREGGEPVKYIWNGETRVARFTRNLHENERLQRVMLFPGWNFVALAVNLSTAAPVLGTPGVEAVFVLDTTPDGTYRALAAGESIPAGTLLRLRVTTATELTLRGTSPASATQTVPAGPQWLVNAGFIARPVADFLPVPAGPASFFEAATQRWRHQLPEPLAAAGNLPSWLGPGQALSATPTASFTIEPVDPSLEARYYHQDHIGSSSVMTDASGQLVSETTYYPFGHPRHEYEPRGMREAYGFTQKERDAESGLHYFEARFYASNIGVFMSSDPLKCKTVGYLVKYPQQFNPYSYCQNRPMYFTDPTGLSEEARTRLETVIQAAQESYGNRPSGATECNGGTQQVMQSLNAPMVQGTANQMYDQLTAQASQQNGQYRQVSGQEAQELANQGTLVIAAQKNTGSESGHVSPVAPGQTSPSSRPRFSNGNNPMIGNIGNDSSATATCNPNTSTQKASCVFSNRESFTDISYFTPNIQINVSASSPNGSTEVIRQNQPNTATTIPQLNQ